VGAALVLILGVAPLIGINLYAERLAEPPMPAAKPVPRVLGSPVELAGAQLASEGGCLAEAIYYEARGESLDGQKAVAEVVLRRTHDKNYARTVCGVVHEGVQEGHLGCQFSYACDGSTRRTKEGESWDQARLLAERIMSGAVQLGDATGHAIAYHSIGVSPPWKEKMQKTVQIGNHIFYRFITRSQLAQVGAGAVTNTSAATAATPSQDVEPKIKTLRAVGEGA
jgi:hypothetical protein